MDTHLKNAGELERRRFMSLAAKGSNARQDEQQVAMAMQKDYLAMLSGERVLLWTAKTKQALLAGLRSAAERIGCATATTWGTRGAGFGFRCTPAVPPFCFGFGSSSKLTSASSFLKG